ncbi:GM19291 [Drosophila sechellia]|uniref:GM19291 n=1 Tax=Drosophila sechellia TaxID=7238 RepID=B4ILW8_DROSE|nr:GM19291 [Drosophila sechellia]
MPQCPKAIDDSATRWTPSLLPHVQRGSIRCAYSAKGSPGKPILVSGNMICANMSTPKIISINFDRA